MTLAITEEHQELARTLRRFLERNCPPEVARSGLDADNESLPPFWGDAAAMGWLGLHVDPAHGGSGYGLGELAVVVEELGRAGAPGPFLPTVLTSALISAGGSDQASKEWLPGLADGSLVGAVAVGAAGDVEAAAGASPGELVLTGTLRPVMSAALANVVVVPARHGDRTVWCVLPASEVETEPLTSLDPTRRVAEVRVREVAVGPAALLQLDGFDAEDLAAVLVAAECAGGAAWCVETASEYARTREQFGRPIGQFQGVKHRCADMLIDLETIRAAAWEASAALAPALQGAALGPEARLSAGISGAVAASAFHRITKACIQVLGGIGFTWEHEAHRYLRRSTTWLALQRGTGPWRHQVAELALAGVRPRPAGDNLLAGAASARRSIRAEVESIAALPKEKWRQALVDSGLFVPHWPRPWGRDAGAIDQLVIDEELAGVGIRRANLAVGAWAAPTIAAHGTPEQQERWIRPTLLGQVKWCQLFSEPGAGSDLASLTTRATRTDGGWLLNGQKVWTSLAADADWGICLARTNPGAAKHLGITYFVVDMKAAGIEIRPLRELTGMAMFNEVFLTDVFVPDENVVGQVDGGWPLARTTLANERVAMGSGASFGGGMEALLLLVGTLELDALAKDRLGELVAESHCLSVMGRRSAHRAVAGARPGPESSVRKLLGAEHDQRTQEFGLSLLGPEAATTEGPAAQWSFGFLANRCLTIAGGTSEVQRNVIAERLLGLPRDP